MSSRYNELPILDKCLGKTIAKMEVHPEAWGAQIIFTDGSKLKINVRAQYCDDAWLDFEWLSKETNG